MGSAPIYCEEAKKLLDAFGDTVHDLVKLHQDQFQAVVAGDPDSARFDDLIHIANEKKRDAKYAYLSHLDNHACSTAAPEDLKRSG